MEGSGEIGFNDCVVSFGQGPSSGGHMYVHIDSACVVKSCTT